MLLEQHRAHDGDQHDAHARPDGVGDADRNLAQRQRQEVERDQVAEHGDDGRHQAGEAFGALQGAGGEDLGNDRHAQV
ncbi:hypothetical protein D3C78_1604410 [compost metagenome]